jgi:hypothetical protein
MFGSSPPIVINSGKRMQMGLSLYVCVLSVENTALTWTFSGLRVSRNLGQGITSRIKIRSYLPMTHGVIGIVGRMAKALMLSLSLRVSQTICTSGLILLMIKGNGFFGWTR